MMQGREPSPEPTEPDIEMEGLSGDEEQPTTRKRKCKNKRRFSDEQVKSLETIFESETKLEPRKKVQVARDLGLQPRQVAIWFQNKRARWKSKQIEKNYRVLKANYDNLKSRLEAIKEERESLLEQLQELRSLLEKSHDRENGCKDFMGRSSHEMIRENGETVTGVTAKTGSLQEEIMDYQGAIYSDDDKSGNIAYLKHEEPELLKISENIDFSLISPMKWCSFDAGSLFDQTSTSSHWWDTWT